MMESDIRGLPISFSKIPFDFGKSIIACGIERGLSWDPRWLIKDDEIFVFKNNHRGRNFKRRIAGDFVFVEPNRKLSSDVNGFRSDSHPFVVEVDGASD